MIEIRGQLCYSPQPPNNYGRGPLGHGPFCKGNIPQWNLIYITEPRVDEYLLPNADVLKIATTIPSHVLANAIAMTRGMNCLRLFPRLNEALLMPPLEFIREVMSMQYRAMPTYLSDPKWIAKIQARAVDISGDVEARSWLETQKLCDVLLRGSNIVKPPGD